MHPPPPCARSGGVSHSLQPRNSPCGAFGERLPSKKDGELFVFIVGVAGQSFQAERGDGDLANLGSVRTTAHQFQDWVHDKHHEARVIVVGDQIFAVFIHAGSPASRIDWRADYAALRYELTELPVTVENGVRGYMAAFGLVYAAFDFAIDAADQWFFLEANTAGQYGFLESNTGAPISASLADLLAGGLRGRLDRPRRASGRRAH
ncbi:MAG: hypothetical protein JO272_09880 [Pseudonocardiales bacterium]|nr:hypothetical protein [Pseudonocardiales bacterium]